MSARLSRRVHPAGTRFPRRVLDNALRLVTRARDRLLTRRLQRKVAEIDRELDQLGQHLLEETPCPP
jgi:hypothetical protein